MIITEKNIDQLTTLIKGNNISKLTKFSSFSEILKNNIEKLTGKKIEEIPKENIEEAEENKRKIVLQAKEDERKWEIWLPSQRIDCQVYVWMRESWLYVG